MATPKDVQDLLRLLTTGRNKISMLAAMGRVRELRNAELHSIAAIASSNVQTIQKALPDGNEKNAKALLAACKACVKKDKDVDASPSNDGNNKRPLLEMDRESESKRLKSAYSLPDEAQTPTEREAALRLPQPDRDEEAIERCVVLTNRAPLLLVFALVALRYTMPRQPLSGSLSLAQAVVGVNARGKAGVLGLGGGGGDDNGEGYPKVKILGREVAVLKRGEYEWEVKGEGREAVKKEEPDIMGSSASTIKQETPSQHPSSTIWTVSNPISSKSSTFIARSIPVSSPIEAQTLLSILLTSTPALTQANHNMTAYRIPTPNGILEDSNDDGESGGGNHLLSVLRENNVTGVLLLVSRWYGGIMLGPDRWRIMSQVSRDALSQRLRVVGDIGEEALWGLDLSGKDGARVGEMAVHQPESARAYILKAFPSVEEEKVEEEGGAKGKGKKRKKTAAEGNREKEVNLGLLMGALELLFESWVDVLGREELDRRAWGWYCAVRPAVEAGPAGWGGKGIVRLGGILKLRRVAQ